MHKRSAFLLITLLGVLLLGSALAAPLFTDCVKEPVLLSMSPENPVAGKDELVIEYEITPYEGYELDWTDATSNDCKFSVKSTGGGSELFSGFIETVRDYNDPYFETNYQKSTVNDGLKLSVIVKSSAAYYMGNTVVAGYENNGIKQYYYNVRSDSVNWQAPSIEISTPYTQENPLELKLNEVYYFNTDPLITAAITDIDGGLGYSVNGKLVDGLTIVRNSSASVFFSDSACEDYFSRLRPDRIQSRVEAIIAKKASDGSCKFRYILSGASGNIYWVDFYIKALENSAQPNVSISINGGNEEMLFIPYDTETHSFNVSFKLKDGANMDDYFFTVVSRGGNLGFAEDASDPKKYALDYKINNDYLGASGSLVSSVDFSVKALAESNNSTLEVFVYDKDMNTLITGKSVKLLTREPFTNPASTVAPVEKYKNGATVVKNALINPKELFAFDVSNWPDNVDISVTGNAYNSFEGMYIPFQDMTVTAKLIDKPSQTTSVNLTVRDYEYFDDVIWIDNEFLMLSAYGKPFTAQFDVYKRAGGVNKGKMTAEELKDFSFAVYPGNVTNAKVTVVGDQVVLNCDIPTKEALNNRIYADFAITPKDASGVYETASKRGYVRLADAVPAFNGFKVVYPEGTGNLALEGKDYTVKFLPTKDDERVKITDMASWNFTAECIAAGPGSDRMNPTCVLKTDPELGDYYEVTSKYFSVSGQAGRVALALDFEDGSYFIGQTCFPRAAQPVGTINSAYISSHKYDGIFDGKSFMIPGEYFNYFANLDNQNDHPNVIFAVQAKNAQGGWDEYVLDADGALPDQLKRKAVYSFYADKPGVIRLRAYGYKADGTFTDGVFSEEVTIIDPTKDKLPLMYDNDYNIYDNGDGTIDLELGWCEAYDQLNLEFKPGETTYTGVEGVTVDSAAISTKRGRAITFKVSDVATVYSFTATVKATLGGIPCEGTFTVSTKGLDTPSASYDIELGKDLDGYKLFGVDDASRRLVRFYRVSGNSVDCYSDELDAWQVGTTVVGLYRYMDFTSEGVLKQGATPISTRTVNVVPGDYNDYELRGKEIIMAFGAPKDVEIPLNAQMDGIWVEVPISADKYEARFSYWNMDSLAEPAISIADGKIKFTVPAIDPSLMDGNGAWGGDFEIELLTKKANGEIDALVNPITGYLWVSAYENRPAFTGLEIDEAQGGYTNANYRNGTYDFYFIPIDENDERVTDIPDGYTFDFNYNVRWNYYVPGDHPADERYIEAIASEVVQIGAADELKVTLKLNNYTPQTSETVDTMLGIIAKDSDGLEVCNYGFNFRVFASNGPEQVPARIEVYVNDRGSSKQNTIPLGTGYSVDYFLYDADGKWIKNYPGTKVEHQYFKDGEWKTATAEELRAGVNYPAKLIESYYADDSFVSLSLGKIRAVVSAFDVNGTELVKTISEESEIVPAATSVTLKIAPDAVIAQNGRLLFEDAFTVVPENGAFIINESDQDNDIELDREIQAIIAPTSASGVGDTDVITAYAPGKGSQRVNLNISISPAKNAITDEMVSVADAEFTGNAIEPAVTVTFEGDVLTLDTDFTAQYADNVNVTTADKKASVTVTGIGAYSGSVKKEFIITPRDINGATVADIPAQTYTGEDIKPLPVVKDGETTLVKDTDYEVSFGKNINAGEAEATIAGKGNYTGSVTKSFTIDKANQAAPNAVAAVAPTLKGKPDGKITGLTDKMEYKKPTDAAYTSAGTATKIVNLSAGDEYLVRFVEDANHEAGLDATVTVPQSLNTITVTFDPNYEGGMPVSVGGVSYNEVMNDSKIPAFARNGYTLSDDWYTDKGCTAVWDKKATADITVYAKWEGEKTFYTVRVYEEDLNGGYALKTPTVNVPDVNVGDKTNEYAGTTPDGFTRVPTAPKTIEPDGKTILDVYYTRNLNQLTFTADGVKLFDAKVKFGAKIVTPAVNVEGKLFRGWDRAVEATMPDRPLSYTAILADADTAFTVVYMKQNIEKTDYVKADEKSLTAPTESEADDLYQAAIGLVDYPGFTTPAAADVALDGKTLTLEYDRISYELKVIVDSNLTVTLDGVALSEDTTTESFAYGKPVKIKAEWKNNAGDTHSWKGWTSSDEILLTSVTGGEYNFGMPAGDVTLTAKVEPITYTVVFSPNGGIGGATKAFSSGKTVTYDIIPAPTREGYTFAGWFTDKDGTTAATKITSDITLYAKWTPNDNTPYAVEHYLEKLNGGYELKDTDSKNGTTADDTEAEANDYTGFTAPAVTQAKIAADGKTVVRIKYARDSFKLTFDADGGTGGFADRMTKFAQTIIAPEVNRTGYEFAGWTDANGDAVTVAATMPAADTTYKASWTASAGTAYTVEHKLETLTGAYELKDTVTMTGTTGDNTSAAAKTYAGFTAKPITQMSINADGTTKVAIEYTRNRYALKFDAAGGNGSAQSSLLFGAAVAAPSVTRPGYDFSGWDEEVPATMPANDATFTAQWTPRGDTPYRVEYYLEDMDGNWPETPSSTENKVGTTDAEASEIIPDGKFEGFELVAELSLNAQTVRPDGATALKFYFKRLIYDLEFDTDGDGNTDLSYKVKYGAAINQRIDAMSKSIVEAVDGLTQITEPVPVKENSAFNGWKVETAQGKAVEVAAGSDALPIRATGDMKCKALWSSLDSVKCVIKYYAQNGSVYKGQDVRYFAEDSDTLTIAPREFAGFAFEKIEEVTGAKAEEKDGGVLVTKNAGAGEVTLKLYYKVAKYDVTVVKGEGIASVTATSSAKAGERVTVTAELTDGYEFVGFENVAEAGYSVLPGSAVSPYEFTMPEGNVKLAAKAKAATYTITYNNTDLAPGEYTFGKGLTLPVAISANGTQITDGWKDGDKTITALTATDFGDKTLEPNWKDLVYLTFDAGEGKIGNDSVKTYPKAEGAAFAAPEATRTGYKLRGWYANNVKYEGTAPDTNTTYTAQWESADPGKVTGVTLNKNYLQLKVGASETLVATVQPSTATNRNVFWSTSDSAVATVSNGVVKGVKDGSAVITVTTSDGGFTAICYVTVAKVPVKGVKLSDSLLSVNVGATKTLVATLDPVDATEKGLKWTTSDAKVATVSSGAVTGVGEGKATITVTTVDGGFTATCEVTVKKVAATGIKLSRSEMVLGVGATGTLVAAVEPSDASDKSVKWTTSASKVATVSNGVVTAKSIGTATITATTVDGGFTASCLVTVDAAEKINVAVPIRAVALGKTLTLPEIAGYTGVWSVKDAKIASVVNNKTVATLNYGVTKLTFTVTGVSGKAQEVNGGILQKGVAHELIELRVRKESELVKKVTVAKGKIKINPAEDKIYEIKAKVKPAKKALDKELFFVSGAPDVVSVSESGRLTAHKPGKAVITVYSTSMKKAEVKVTVTGLVTSIKLKNADGGKLKKPTLKVGETLALLAVTNADALDKTVKWSSSDESVAKVDASGKVTAIKNGSVKITALANDSSGVKAVVKIKVK